MEQPLYTELSRTEAEDIAYVIGLANDFAINIVSTNATIILLDMKIDIDGSGTTHLGSVVWSTDLEEFVFRAKDWS